MASANARVLPGPFAELTPPEGDPLHEQVYARVRQAIVSGAIRPGTALSVRGLSGALGTSPMPVREALRRLIAERALVVLPNRTVVLPLPTSERFAEVRRLRIAIEGMLVEAAAVRMSAEDLEWLAATEVEMEAAEEGAPDSYLAQHSDFHFRIYRAAGLPTALAITESLWLQTGPMLHHVMGRQTLGTARGQHKAVIVALRRGDAAAARRALETDIHEPGEVILALLREREAQG